MSAETLSLQMRWDFDGSTDRALFEELKAKGLIQEKEVLEDIQLDTNTKIIIIWDSL